MTNPATTRSQEFTSGSGTFTVADGVSEIRVTMIGGGGAGLAKVSGVVGCGGGSGEYCIRTPLHVTPGSPNPTFAYSVGTGGVGTTVGANGPDGTASTFGPLTCRPGFGVTTGNVPGSGGGPGGGVGLSTQIPGAPGTFEGSWFTGGAAGGTGRNAGVGLAGGPAVGYSGAAGGSVATNGGGGGGGSSPWGDGGVGGNGSAGAAGSGGDAPATSYGAGGGGSGGGTGSPTGGDGAGGYILVEWVAAT